jgi:hypothetical protein
MDASVSAPDYRSRQIRRSVSAPVPLERCHLVGDVDNGLKNGGFKNIEDILESES